MMSYLYTTLGPLSAEQLGMILPHEHVFVDLRTPDQPGYAEADAASVVALMVPQIEAIKQTALVAGIARTTANFVSSEPRPVDGRVTVTSYALGEESFIDTNGNNAYDPGEPFQDIGNIFKDRNFDGRFDSTVDEFVSLNINNSNACLAPGNPLLSLDASIPSVSIANGAAGDTCDGRWSGAGQVYVRRAVETVLSTSAARPLWASTRGLSNTCVSSRLTMQVGPSPTQTAVFTAVAGDTWYGGASDTLSFIVADANP